MNWKKQNEKKNKKKGTTASLNSPEFAGCEIVRAAGTKCSPQRNKQMIYGIMVNYGELW